MQDVQRLKHVDRVSALRYGDDDAALICAVIGERFGCSERVRADAATAQGERTDLRSEQRAAATNDDGLTVDRAREARRRVRTGQPLPNRRLFANFAFEKAPERSVHL